MAVAPRKILINHSQFSHSQLERESKASPQNNSLRPRQKLDNEVRGLDEEAMYSLSDSFRTIVSDPRLNSLIVEEYKENQPLHQMFDRPRASQNLNKTEKSGKNYFLASLVQTPSHVYRSFRFVLRFHPQQVYLPYSL
jgi:hypothetical protein